MNLLALFWTLILLLGFVQSAAVGSIEGTIRLPAGGPAAGVRVAAMAVPGVAPAPTEASVILSITLTDANGFYRLADVPSGRYYITTGAVTNPTYHPGTSSLDSATIVTIATGQALTGYDFPLITSPPSRTPASRASIVSVPGRIVMEDGSPLPKVKLTVNKPPSTSFSERPVDPGGAVWLVLETDVFHQLFVAGLPPDYRLGSVRLGNTDFGLSPLKITAASRDELVLTVVPVPLSSLKTVTVSGTVANIPAEWKIGKRVVELTSLAFGGPTIQALLNPDNSWVAKNVPPGTYQSLIEGLIGQRPVFPAFEVADSDVSGVTINLHNNPFPELPFSPFAPGFDTGNPITVRGVVTQAATQVLGKTPFRYFRMDVKDDATGVVTPWAVSYAGTMDFVPLNVGQTVSVTGAPVGDGTHRLTLDSANSSMIGSINGVPVPQPNR
jgi:hypothetical protein